MMERICCLMGVLLILSCQAGGFGSASPGNEQGQCSLNCDSAIVGASDSAFSLAPATGLDSMTLTCSSGQALARARIFYRAVESIGSGEDIFQRPVPLLAINVIATGLGDSVNGNEVGVVNGADQLCTDSCGNVTFEVDIQCPPDGSSRSALVSVNSGPLIASSPVNISVTSEDTAAEE